MAIDIPTLKQPEFIKKKWELADCTTRTGQKGESLCQVHLQDELIDLRWTRRQARHAKPSQRRWNVLAKARSIGLAGDNHVCLDSGAALEFKP